MNLVKNSSAFNALQAVLLASIVFLIFGLVLQLMNNPNSIYKHSHLIVWAFATLFLPIATWRIHKIGRPTCFPPERAQGFLNTLDWSDVMHAHHAAEKNIRTTHLSTLVEQAKNQLKSINGSHSEEFDQYMLFISVLRHIIGHNFSHGDGKPHALCLDDYLGPKISLSIIGTPENTAKLGYPHEQEIDVISAKNSGSNIANDLKDDVRFYDISHLFIRKVPGDAILDLRGLRIGQLILDNPICGTISIRSCWIGEILFRGEATSCELDVHVSSSLVRKIIFADNCCNNFSIYSTYIKRITYAKRGSAVPFRGKFSMDRASEIFADMCYDSEGALQSCRNLRRALTEQDNIRPARVIRAIELRKEREGEALLVRIVSQALDLVSGYGTVPERALAFAALLAIYNGVVIGLSGTWHLNVPCESLRPEGWARNLCASDLQADLFAAFLLALSPLTDPLGVFSANTLVSPQYFWMAILHWVSKTAVLGLIAIAILGIRQKLIDD